MSADGNWKINSTNPTPAGDLQVDDILRISSSGIQVDRIRGPWGTGYDGDRAFYKTKEWSLRTSGVSPNRTLTAEKNGGEGDEWTAQEQVPPPPPPK